ncbi:Crp/Fnr family transcriptional regulator [uncultured Psychroserpens sp.]|uniref:Crp/Fnr family transcriptional regulator n=1 Tax=uncultured Psychroserpens sp. TaxID=255436 RepID=UPI00260B1C3E|nr:Crp/Fnr family transcriptional regulator [uncultured Psychroserpens sp.]
MSKANFENYLRLVINDNRLEDGVSEISGVFQKISLKRNDFFVKEGEVCPYFCFIEAGVLQHSILVSGEEKTTYLAMTNSCTSALKSFINNEASRKSIKAISACELWVINLDGFNYLLENNTGFYKFYYNLIENQIYLIDDYRIDLLTLSPEERYKKLLSNDSKLLQQVPLHYLASFLGISDRHMSRIRKNIN